MAVLLNDPVTVARDPEVIICVERAAVHALDRNPVRIAPVGDQVTVLVEHENVACRHKAPLRLIRGYAAAVEHDDVIVGIHADTPERSVQPTLGQRFRPAGIDLEGRHVLGSCRQCEQAPDDEVTAHHAPVLSALVIAADSASSSRGRSRSPASRSAAHNAIARYLRTARPYARDPRARNRPRSSCRPRSAHNVR